MNYKKKEINIISFIQKLLSFSLNKKKLLFRLSEGVQ